MFRKSKTEALAQVKAEWARRVNAKNQAKADACAHAWKSVAQGSNVVRCETCGDERAIV